MIIILKLENISKIYKENIVVNKVNFTLKKGESLGIAGESGAGKSTLARLILGIEEPTEGNIYIDTKTLKESDIRMQMIFQNTFESLDPRWTLERTILEPVSINKKVNYSPLKLKKLLYETIKDVGLEKDILLKRPSELSGGEIQRACIARAIISKPDIIICDEPTSNLDFIIKKKILDLFKYIKKKYNLSLLIITHDLSLINSICDRALIMKDGEIVDVLDNKKGSDKLNPYTKKMLDSIATNNPRNRNIIKF